MSETGRFASKRFVKRLVLVTLLASVPAGCGAIPSKWWKVTDNKDDKSDDKKSTEGMVVGYWTGIFQERGTDGKLIDPVPVEIELTRGTSFGLIFPQKDGVFVRGDYSEFPTRQTLMFTIRESTFSLVGAPGRLVNMQYRVEGDWLTLTGDSGEYTVKRAVKVGPGGPTEATIHGAWRCDDAQKNRWVLTIDLPKGRFGAWVSSGGKPLIIDGAVAPDGAAYLLTVETSNKPGVVGGRLSVSLSAEGGLSVKASDAPSSEAFACRR